MREQRCDYPRPVLARSFMSRQSRPRGVQPVSHSPPSDSGQSCLDVVPTPPKQRVNGSLRPVKRPRKRSDCRRRLAGRDRTDRGKTLELPLWPRTRGLVLFLQIALSAPCDRRVSERCQVRAAEPHVCSRTLQEMSAPRFHLAAQTFSLVTIAASQSDTQAS